MNVLYVLVEDITDKWKLFKQHSRFWTEYFGETLLRTKRMVAKFWLTDPLPKLIVGSVLVVFGVSRSES